MQPNYISDFLRHARNRFALPVLLEKAISYASCFFYSMIETAKMNGLNPYGYLKWNFETGDS
ncbi:MAG: hypothetical protein DRP70_08080 [Spirochaetes bacterium]|nr:MAG: hypothetical protein DRP60_09275 [Spirochaetota bacterium]RKX87608.1 MAG: hypothetical protein DRP70_08080 [Spirochaetota bacterium]RKX94409.1 MAG: hypothetical protein DRZ90_11920 [Spirochaetota bacterium]